MNLQIADFHRWCVEKKRIPLSEVIELCEGKNYQRYVALFEEWERDCDKDSDDSGK